MKLLNVLEVLNFFGYSADNLTNCVLLEDGFYNNLENDNLLAKPPISWVQHDHHFAYSAFWSTLKQSVHLMLLGPVSAFSDYECRVWFQLVDMYVSRPGKLTYRVGRITHDPNFHEYEVYCTPNEIPADTIPYGILLGKKDELKLFVPIEVQKEAHPKDRLIICIAPDYSGNPDLNLIELIAYHTLLGVNHFVIYDIGIHYQVIQFLRSLAGHRDLYKTISSLSWQFPTMDSELEKSILEKDCKQRTKGYAHHSILLSWDQYLVLNQDIRLNYLNKDLDFVFEIKKCCYNRQLKKSWPMAMKKTLCEKTNQTVDFIVDDRIKTHLTPTALGSIHKLEDICEKPIGKDDKNMAKFLINFVNSKLLSLWKSHLNYSFVRIKNNSAINL